MPGPIGRAATNSDKRTPQLVREHLTKLGEQGDHISAIHQGVKAMLRERAPNYHWPRRHSFQALIGRLLAIGLLEKTGQREDPKGRGAGVLGADRGWRQRVWVRLMPGAEDSPFWSNPMGAGGGGPSPAPVEGPAPPRGGRRARELAPPEETDQGFPARVQALERARQGLVQRLVTASETPGRPEDFESLHQAARRFLGGVSAMYDTEQFPDAAEAIAQLANCIRLFELERALTQRRVQALRNCQTWAGLLAQSLSSALRIPRGAPARTEHPMPPPEPGPEEEELVEEEPETER